jgi:hypothetical protein
LLNSTCRRIWHNEHCSGISEARGATKAPATATGARAGAMFGLGGGTGSGGGPGTADEETETASSAGAVDAGGSAAGSGSPSRGRGGQHPAVVPSRGPFSVVKHCSNEASRKQHTGPIPHIDEHRAPYHCTQLRCFPNPQQANQERCCQGLCWCTAGNPSKVP